MAGRRRRSSRKSPWIVMIVALVLAFVGWCSNGDFRLEELFSDEMVSDSSQASEVQPVSGEETQIYYLDVGQGDSQLICLPDGKNILIDSGTQDTADELTAYLKDLGIEKIDFLIATHPHEDHIGGMKNVVENFEIGKIYMPKISDSQIPTTRVYENLLASIEEKGLKITMAKAGEVILEENGVKMEILAPNSEKYADLNSYSIVTKLSVGEKAFLFTGDAESDSEEEMLAKGYDLKADFLKLGHHGSSTSNSLDFLKAVSPEAAVISCGVDNDYGHPHQEVLDRLEELGVQVYRTDTQDTILVRCDGSSLTVETNLKSIVKTK